MGTTMDNSDKQNGHPPKRHHRRYAYFREDQLIFLVTHDTATVSDELLRAFNKRLNSELGEEKGVFPDDLPKKISFPTPVLTDAEYDRSLTKLQNPTGRGEEETKRRAEEARQRTEANRKKELERLKGYLNKKETRTELQNLLLSYDYSKPVYQPAPIRRSFSLLFCTLKNIPTERTSVLANILNLRSTLRGESISIKKETTSYEPELPAGVVVPGTEAMTIEDMSPNWTMSAVPNGSGTGGPGGLPRPFKGTDKDVEDAAKYKFDITARLNHSYGNGEGVDVAVLDTAPCAHELAIAPKYFPDNELIQTLLGDDGKLILYPATLKELRRMDNASLNWHDYEMSYHGLFAAGMIHSIVPEATIHLIEVLNQWGVGDLESLTAGLKKAYKQIYQPESGRRLVVNCSWMLDLPLVGEHCSAIDARDPEYDFEQAILHFALAERESASALLAVCNNIFLKGGQVVAAAGNDWNKERKDNQNKSQGSTGARTQRQRKDDAPEARYPAGFVSVIGVGALPKNSKPTGETKHRASNYSNLGDKPEMTAIMTLGGEEGETDGENNGVLGLYLGEKYPVEDPSLPKPPRHRRKFKSVERTDEEKNSWAWWSGTSFAAPIVTGTIASLLTTPGNSGGITPSEVMDLVRGLYTAGIIIGNTDAEEDVMEVKQG